MAQDAEWGELAVAIDGALRRVGMALRRGHRHSPVELDLTLGQLHCLGAISCLGKPSMSDLSSALDLRPSTVTGLVDALIERGHPRPRRGHQQR
jgi:DNA-binding MarR family transcriptional regulator